MKTPKEEVAFCPSCDAEIPLDAEKCPNCGAEFEMEEAEEVEESTSAEIEEEAAFCPSCDAEIPADAEKCPNCGAEFEMEGEEEVEEAPSAEIEDEEEEEAEDLEEEEEEELEEEEAAPVDRLANLKRDRILYYVGLALIGVGGPGLALSSWLHDLFRVPIVGETYGAFGWINVYFAIAGAIMLVVGIIFFILSLKGGIVTPEDIETHETEILEAEG
ncbi:MAG: zinc ribbon domain-containing protein [Thermoplasmata archaeon]|nr:zinc ribbon domain-containing protein [Thermoplasmata archaeon]